MSGPSTSLLLLPAPRKTSGRKRNACATSNGGETAEMAEIRGQIVRLADQVADARTVIAVREELFGREPFHEEHLRTLHSVAQKLGILRTALERAQAQYWRMHAVAVMARRQLAAMSREVECPT